MSCHLSDISKVEYNKCSDRSMEVKPSEIMTDRPTDQPTDKLGYWEVSLTIRK